MSDYNELLELGHGEINRLAFKRWREEHPVRPARLEGANLHKVTLCGADLKGHHFRGANFSESDLTGADLTKALLDDADLSKVVFGNAILLSTTLGKANLTYADMADIRGITAEQLFECRGLEYVINPCRAVAMALMTQQIREIRSQLYREFGRG